MTVYKNMAFALKLRKFSKAEIETRVVDAAKMLGIEELLDRKPKALSGGQRQRVAVGRAIVRQPAAFGAGSLPVQGSLFNRDFQRPVQKESMSRLNADFKAEGSIRRFRRNRNAPIDDAVSIHAPRGSSDNAYKINGLIGLGIVVFLDLPDQIRDRKIPTGLIENCRRIYPQDNNLSNFVPRITAGHQARFQI